MSTRNDCTSCHVAAEHPFTNCTGCHQDDPLYDPHGANRYGPVGPCYDCHGTGYTHSISLDCAYCHASTQWLQIPRHDAAAVDAKHVKPNPMKGVQGGIVDKTLPIHQSNVAIYNAAKAKADRVGIKLLADGKKVRVFKSTGEEIKA